LFFFFIASFFYLNLKIKTARARSAQSPRVKAIIVLPREKSSFFSALCEFSRKTRLN